MTQEQHPSRPIGAAGKKLWREIAERWELDRRELIVLTEACRVADQLAALEKLVAAEGVMITAPTGQRRLHPGVAECRQQRLVLSRLLGALDLPAEDGEPASAASIKARKAARARWDRLRLMEGANGQAATNG